MIALMFVTASGMANDEKLSLERSKESKSLVFENDAIKETEIKLYDDADHIIYSERIPAMSYSKRINLKNVADGTYYFTTEDALKKVTYTIAVRNFKVEIIGKTEKVKPVFRREGRRIYVHLLNLSKKEVGIEIYDSNNRLVYTEKRENEMVIEKVLNFTKAFADKYTVVVKDDDNTYYENVVVN